MDPLGLGIAMLLAFRFFLVLLFVGQIWIEIDLGELVNQIRQHERVWIIWIEEAAALLGKIGFVRFLVDGEEQFFFEREQFFLARIPVKRKLGFIDGAALVRIFHHPQKLLIAR